MKKTANSYFKAVGIIFFIVLIVYIIFEITIGHSLTSLWQNIIKILLLALLLPLFSQKYIAQIISAEELKKFNQRRRKIYIFLGTFFFIVIILAIITVITSSQFK